MKTTKIWSFGSRHWNFVAFSFSFGVNCFKNQPWPDNRQYALCGNLDNYQNSGQFKCTHLCTDTRKVNPICASIPKRAKHANVSLLRSFSQTRETFRRRWTTRYLWLTVSGFAWCTRSFDGMQSCFKVYLFKTWYGVLCDISECFSTKKKGGRVKARSVFFEDKKEKNLSYFIFFPSFLGSSSWIK